MVGSKVTISYSKIVNAPCYVSNLIVRYDIKVFLLVALPISKLPLYSPFILELSYQSLTLNPPPVSPKVAVQEFYSSDM